MGREEEDKGKEMAGSHTGLAPPLRLGEGGGQRGKRRSKAEKMLGLDLPCLLRLGGKRQGGRIKAKTRQPCHHDKALLFYCASAAAWKRKESHVSHR